MERDKVWKYVLEAPKIQNDFPSPKQQDVLVSGTGIRLKNSTLGVSNLSFCLGQLLIFFCMLTIFLSVISSRLVCFGIYCLMSLFVFSIAPFCHEA